MSKQITTSRIEVLYTEGEFDVVVCVTNKGRSMPFLRSRA